MMSGVSEKDANILINLCAKICKMIMRKLSATHDTEFRGRVQKLIASVFPLTHPSGLNKPGNFNTKNLTSFENIEEIKEQRHSLGQDVSDSRLYRNFWSLQKYLSNPFNVSATNS